MTEDLSQHLLNCQSRPNCRVYLTEDTICEPYWWWFGLSAAILLVSTSISAYFYSSGARAGGPVRQCALFLASMFQLSYLVDLCNAISGRDQHEDGREAILVRDIAVKMLECTPQLYLQSYVFLLTVSVHRDLFRVTSVLTSAVSLSVGLTKFWAAAAPRFERFFPRFRQKVAFGAFLASDQLLRAAGYAFAFSRAVRPIGIPLAVLFLLVAFVVSWKVEGSPCIGFLSGIVGGILVPLSSLGDCLRPAQAKSRMKDTCWRTFYIYGLLPFRYLEMTIYGLLGLTIAKTTCGLPPIDEVAMFFGLMAFNLVLLVFMRTCMSWENRESRKGIEGQVQSGMELEAVTFGIPFPGIE
ncbi:unnamed protein product [Symbiodinium natans]|uniref:Uncharacterized protein n=1 Tax=Symbiodinium natans TaxID=878477 RepID=A0A812NAS6_9DINO|nr:unnamed protein product [Symbiodinium natans]